MKCYNASFNVGNMEIWSSDLFFHKKDVLLDIEESLDEIAMEIAEFIFLPENKINEILEKALKKMKRTGEYKDNENNLDFFILDQYVWKDMLDKIIFTKNIKIEE
jgi:hypothetical protein